MRKTRRRLLTALAALTAASACGAERLLARSIPTPQSNDIAAARLAGIFTAPGSAAVIGREYLASVPHEADPALLVPLVCPALPARDLAELPRHELYQMVTERHVGDFAQSRTVSVGGWILSRTEARVCALAALGGAARIV